MKRHACQLLNQYKPELRLHAAQLRNRAARNMDIMDTGLETRGSLRPLSQREGS